MTISADTFMHIADGKLTFQQAYSERKLMITGSGVITSCLGIDVSTNSGLSFCAFLKQFAQNIIDDPFLTESIQNIYQLNVTTETNMMKSWVIDLKNRPPCLFEGELMEADCGITISAKDFMHIIEGDLDSETAFTERKMMVTGNLDMVMDFWQVLRESLKSSQMDIEDMPLNPEPESHSVSDEMDIEDMPLNPEPEPPSVSDEMDIEDMPLDMPLNPEQEVHSVSDEMDIEDMPLNAEPEVHSVSDEMDIKDMPLNPKPEVHSVSDEMDIEDMPLNAEPESELPSTIGQCKATTLAGNRCRNKIMDGSEYCHIHHRKIHGDEIMDEFNIPL
ncbi:MAG: hypothetical protein B6242_09375 [Anaerolineaceae bacterium 4572_78]|nr:MAG: hypothetical protein B6242_09375 [Anaerolineaceae bacterium 4572_78]